MTKTSLTGTFEFHHASNLLALRLNWAFHVLLSGFLGESFGLGFLLLFADGAFLIAGSLLLRTRFSAIWPLSLLVPRLSGILLVLLHRCCLQANNQ
jgi:hypothetical protein